MAPFQRAVAVRSVAACFSSLFACVPLTSLLPLFVVTFARAEKVDEMGGGGGRAREGRPRQPHTSSPLAPPAPLSCLYPPCRPPPSCQAKRCLACLPRASTKPPPDPYLASSRCPRPAFFPPQLDGFGVPASALESAAGSAKLGFSEDVVRTSEYMTHPVFNTHHSEVRESGGTHAFPSARWWEGGARKCRAARVAVAPETCYFLCFVRCCFRRLGWFPTAED